jgi:hypothetical protein
LTEMTPAPTHTMMKTISNRRVLSSALVAELRTLKEMYELKYFKLTLQALGRIRTVPRGPLIAKVFRISVIAYNF